VERPKRRQRSSRRNVKKTDPFDAESAARAVLAGETSGVPKSGEGCVEMRDDPSLAGGPSLRDEGEDAGC
jgi:hypothetical protein